MLPPIKPGEKPVLHDQQTDLSSGATSSDITSRESRRTGFALFTDSLCFEKLLCFFTGRPPSVDHASLLPAGIGSTFSYDLSGTYVKPGRNVRVCRQHVRMPVNKRIGLKSATEEDASRARNHSLLKASWTSCR